MATPILWPRARLLPPCHGSRLAAAARAAAAVGGAVALLLDVAAAAQLPPNNQPAFCERFWLVGHCGSDCWATHLSAASLLPAF